MSKGKKSTFSSIKLYTYKCIMSHLGDQFLQQNKRTFIRDSKSAIPQQCMSVCGTTYIFGRESVDKFPNEHFGALQCSGKYDDRVSEILGHFPLTCTNTQVYPGLHTGAKSNKKNWVYKPILRHVVFIIFHHYLPRYPSQYHLRIMFDHYHCQNIYSRSQNHSLKKLTTFRRKKLP